MNAREINIDSILNDKFMKKINLGLVWPNK